MQASYSYCFAPPRVKNVHNHYSVSEAKKQALFEKCVVFFILKISVLEVLLEKYPHQKIVLTLGSTGCVYVDAEQKVFHPSFSTKVVDTTGAGDSFCAGFLSAMAKGLSFEECGRFANAVGAHCVMAMGATTGIKSFEEINEFIDTYK